MTKQKFHDGAGLSFGEAILALTPATIGREVVDIGPDGAKAFAGTGFNPDNPQHWMGSDAVRYAIALQQARDAGNFALLDAMKQHIRDSFGWVMQHRDGTSVKSYPSEYPFLSAKQKDAAFKAWKMPVSDGILYDRDSVQGHNEAA